AQGVRRTFGQGAALQQLVLRLVEVAAVRRLGRLHALHLHHLHRLTVDLQRRRGPVHRRRQQSDQKGQRKHAREHAQYQPLALLQDLPVRKEIYLVLVLLRLLEQVERGAGRTQGEHPLLRATPRRKTRVLVVGADGEILVGHRVGRILGGLGRRRVRTTRTRRRRATSG